MWKLQALVLLSIVFTARHDDVHITPSISAGTVSPAPRPRADAWGYLDRQWIGFHHTLVGRRPIAAARLLPPTLLRHRQPVHLNLEKMIDADAVDAVGLRHRSALR